MFIVWGTQHAGKVDRVGDMFHVVTNFGHLYYIPLLPMGSFVVTGTNADGSINGAAIPLSFKSILVGWLRAACVIAMIATAITMAVAMGEGAKPGQQVHWMIPAIFFVLAAVVLGLSYRLSFITAASYERACELGKRLELNDLGQLMLEIHFGRLTAEQADAELARREALTQSESSGNETSSA
jgi:hypothetical protein